jgi:hypothetical protein
MAAKIVDNNRPFHYKQEIRYQHSQRESTNILDLNIWKHYRKSTLIFQNIFT